MLKRVLIPTVVIVFMLLACKASDTGNLVTSRFLCYLFGGTWVEEKSTTFSYEYCRQETDDQSEAQVRPDALVESPGDDASAPDIQAQPQVPSIPIITTGEPENSEFLSVEECDGRPFVVISPVITQEENDCASGYHLTITNNHPSDAIVMIPHFSAQTEEKIENAWYPGLSAQIGPGVSITDAGRGFIVEKWGGFFSTCQMRDGELSFPVYFFTDRISVRKAIDGCEWITGESDLDMLSVQLPNYVEK